MPNLKTYLLIAVAAIAAFILGLSLGGGDQSDTSVPGDSKAKGTIWTCSMHPQVRKPEPGKCPICGMPLVPADAAPSKTAGAEEGPILVLSEHAREMASVETVPVTRRELSKEIRAVGKIQYNETGLATVVTRVDGFIEKLFVDSTGVKMSKGDHLVEIYSQDLAVAQSELLISRNYTTAAGNLADSTKAKMRQWGVSDEEIEKVLKTGKVLPRLTLYAPMSGTVTEKMVVEGSFVNRGDVLYRLANLDSVWVHLDVYEYEIGWVQPGQRVEFTAEAFPGQAFHGLATFISPALNEDTRTIKVRVNIDNHEGKLKPGMFVSSSILVKLLADGKPAPTGAEGKYTCPMHPQILQGAAGNCPVCGMALRQIPGSPAAVPSAAYQVLAVPVSAVLDSGTRKLVYVERSRGEFVPAEITVGPRAGDFYPVVRGLKDGDKVAVRGNFLIDSQFQINGMPSLFYKEGLAPAAGHQHGGGATPATTETPNSGKPAHEGHSPQPAVPPKSEHKH